MGTSEVFERRLGELADRVGHERVRGSVEVDQVYAQYQHEGLDLKHPRGGQAKYLEEPLYDHHRDYLQDIADRVLDGSITQAMADSMEHLSGEVFALAPVEFMDLRASGHPVVRRGGEVAYDRPPMQERLTPAQLKAKDKLRALGDSTWGLDDVLA